MKCYKHIILTGQIPTPLGFQYSNEIETNFNLKAKVQIYIIKLSDSAFIHTVYLKLVCVKKN